MDDAILCGLAMAITLNVLDKNLRKCLLNFIFILFNHNFESKDSMLLTNKTKD